MISETPLEPEVLNALDSGNKIQAIKVLREKRGIGLQEAKDIVDAYESYKQTRP